MPKGVIYKTRKDAQGYADEQAGTVIKVDADKDGVMDGFVVVTDGEDRTTGANPSDVPKADREAHEEYLRKVAGAGGRSISNADRRRAEYLGRNMGGIVEDELGYMSGGMAAYTKRPPIKYSKGGAVKGKKGFKGSY